MKKVNKIKITKINNKNAICQHTSYFKNDTESFLSFLEGAALCIKTFQEFYPNKHFVIESRIGFQK